MPHVDFDEQAKQATPEPSDNTFTLDGRKWTCRDRLDIPSAVVAEYSVASAVFAASPEGVAEQQRFAEASAAFLRAVLMPGEGDELAKALGKNEGLTGRIYQAVISTLWEHATGRPTQPAVRSSTGRKRTARKSTAGSSSRATQRAASGG